MITDLNYLESGLSEEFSSLLINNNIVTEETQIKDLFDTIKEKFKKSDGKKSNNKENHKEEHKEEAAKNKDKKLSDEEKEANKAFVDEFYKTTVPIVNDIVGKYPLVKDVISAVEGLDEYELKDFSNGYYGEMAVAWYNIWDHPEVKEGDNESISSLLEDSEFEKQFKDCVKDIESEINNLGYGSCEYGGEWDDGPIAIYDVYPSKKYKEFINKFLNKEVKESVITKVYGSMNNNSYLYAGAFDSYLRSQSDNELRLQEAVISYITEADENNANTPARPNRRLQDTIAIKWDAFLKFIDGILDRFWQAMDKIVNSQKNYLEKYQDIILKKPPREDIEYEYTGDYTEGMSRCLNTTLPAFNYERDAPFLRQEDLSAAVGDFMSGKNFKYNKDEDLAVQFKNWFIAAERGQTKGKLSNLNMKVLYDFLYNSKNLADSVKKDRSNLQQTRNQLINAVNKELRERGETTQQNQNGANTATNSTGSNTANNNNTTANTNTNTTTNTIAQNASAIEDEINNGWVSLSEADEGNNDGGNQAGKTDLEITNNTPNQKDANGNTSNEGEKNTAGQSSTTEQDIKNIVTKWTNISRSFCTGKLTAIQQISKDYMNLIKAHVRSYGGKGTDGSKQDQNANNGENNTGASGTAQLQANNQQNNNNK